MSAAPLPRNFDSLWRNPFHHFRKELLRFFHHAHELIEAKQPSPVMTEPQLLHLLDQLGELQGAQQMQVPQSGRDTALAYSAEREQLAIERDKVIEVLRTGSCSEPIRTDTPACQALWGVVFAYLHTQEKARHRWGGEFAPQSFGGGYPYAAPATTPGKPLEASPAWQQLLASEGVQRELDFYRQALAYQLSGRDVPVSYGPPGSHFYYETRKGEIVLDLVKSLLCGFEQCRQVGLHEIGHAAFTREFPEEMQAIRQEMELLNQRAKERGNSLSQDDYLRLARLKLLWNLQRDLWNSIEDNCVDSFSASYRQMGMQDYHDAANHNTVVLRGFTQQAEVPPEPNPWAMPDDPKQAQAYLSNLGNIALFCFFTTNHLFEPTLENWRRAGSEPEWLRRFIREGEGWQPRDDQWQPALGRLMHLLTGPEGVANLYPKGRELMLPKADYDALVMDYNRRRNRIVTTIWQEYAAPYAEILARQQQQELEEQIKKGGQKSPSGGGGISVETPDGKQTPMPSIEPPDDQLQPDEKKPSQGQEKEDGKGPGQKEQMSAADEARQRQAAREAARAARQPGEGKGGGKPSGGAEDPKPRPPGSWKNYRSKVNQPAMRRRIDKRREQFDRLAEKQVQITQRIDPEAHSLLPVDGRFMKRYDHNRQRRRERRMQTGEGVTPEDFNDFVIDDVQADPVPLKLLLWIDGSGSMSGAKLGNALDEMVSIVEASRRSPAYNAYLYFFGDKKTTVGSLPGYNDRQRGDAIDALTTGLGGATHLAPTIEQSVRQLSKLPTPDQPVAGFVHILLISDGDLNDPQLATDRIQTLFSHCRYVTLDVIVIDNGKTPSAMSKWAETIQTGRNPPVQVRCITDPTRVQEAMDQSLEHRIKTIRPIEGIDEGIIRQSLTQSYRHMTKGSK